MSSLTAGIFGIALTVCAVLVGFAIGRWGGWIDELDNDVDG